VTPQVCSRTGRAGRSSRRIITGSKGCRDGCRWPDFRSSWACRVSVTRRPPVLCLRLSRVRRVLRPNRRRRRYRGLLPRHRRLLRLSRLPLRVHILRRTRPRRSPPRILSPSAIFRRVRLTRPTVVRTVTQRRLRLRVPSILRVRVTLRAAGLLMDGVAGRLRVLGIAHVRLVQDSPPRWPHRMRWVAASPAY
jgi:hypothetical protein